MGLLDQILTGRARMGQGGLSPLTMLLLGVLAYRAYKGRGGMGGLPPSGDRPSGGPAGSPAPGNFRDLVRGGLGGLIGGGAAGTLLNSGLRDLIGRFQHSGYGDIADSWVGTSPNRAVTPQQVQDALGPETVSTLAREAGINEIDLLQGLSQDLPETVDQLTPAGRLPDDQEAAQWA